MQCQICNKRTATIHLTEITEGVRSEMHVCEHCAAEQGIAAQGQVSINELLSNFLASQPSDEEIMGPATEQEESCPDCGFTLDRLRKEGTLGCPRDYEVFEQSLLPLIERAHNGNSAHCGKVPTKTPGSTKRLAGLSQLRQQLEAAVKSEDYERAAELRDKMKHLES
jgi:protein arginine kinase activator